MKQALSDNAVCRARHGQLTNAALAGLVRYI
jgi:hypothetical protein